jgi:hypothetical protein
VRLKHCPKRGRDIGDAGAHKPLKRTLARMRRKTI